MKFGHHGSNHPVQDLLTKKVFYYSQNHCYTVMKAILKNLKITHKSLFDGTVQGIEHISGNFFSFQGHPEASPGPQESEYIFDKFINIMKKINLPMPKRTDISSILIIGAGPIVIGQACEFDYSGVQACKALKAEGYRIILVNSNPATIMTDPNFADATYIEPVNWQTLEKIIAKELPDAILPTMGGQTAQLCLDLQK